MANQLKNDIKRAYEARDVLEIIKDTDTMYENGDKYNSRYFKAQVIDNSKCHSSFKLYNTVDRLKLKLLYKKNNLL